MNATTLTRMILWLTTALGIYPCAQAQLPVLQSLWESGDPIEDVPDSSFVSDGVIFGVGASGHVACRLVGAAGYVRISPDGTTERLFPDTTNVTGAGLPAGTTFSFADEVLIDAQGRLAIRASLVIPGPGFIQKNALLVGTPGNLVAILAEDGPIPGEGVSVAVLGRVLMNPNGQISCLVTSSANGYTEYLLRGTAAGLSVVAKTGVGGLGGLPPNVELQGLTPFDLADTGEVVFRADLQGVDVAFSNDVALLRIPAASLFIEEFREGVSFQGQAGEPSGPIISPDGTKMVFTTRRFSDSSSRIVLKEGGDFTVIARSGEMAPGTGEPFENSSPFLPLAINSRGDVVFRGLLETDRPLVDFTNNEGVFRYFEATGARPVAFEGQTAPGLPLDHLWTFEDGLELHQDGGLDLQMQVELPDGSDPDPGRDCFLWIDGIVGPELVVSGDSMLRLRSGADVDLTCARLEWADIRETAGESYATRDGRTVLSYTRSGTTWGVAFFDPAGPPANPSLDISMHRVDAGAILNLDAPHTDIPLAVSPDPTLLRNHAPELQEGGGLALDGVTPLLFRVKAIDLDGLDPDDFVFRVSILAGGTLDNPVTLNQVRDGNEWFLTLNAIAPHTLNLDPGASELQAELQVSLAGAGTQVLVRHLFKIRKPPVFILSFDPFSDAVKSVVESRRGEDFVRVFTAVEQDRWAPWILQDVSELDTWLVPFTDAWAVTRPDWIAHGHAGYLALRAMGKAGSTFNYDWEDEEVRFDSRSSSTVGFVNESNFNRGRCRRAILLSVPQAFPSRLTTYTQFFIRQLPDKFQVKPIVSHLFPKSGPAELQADLNWGGLIGFPRDTFDPNAMVHFYTTRHARNSRIMSLLGFTAETFNVLFPNGYDGLYSAENTLAPTDEDTLDDPVSADYATRFDTPLTAYRHSKLFRYFQTQPAGQNTSTALMHALLNGFDQNVFIPINNIRNLPSWEVLESIIDPVSIATWNDAATIGAARIQLILALRNLTAKGAAPRRFQYEFPIDPGHPIASNVIWFAELFGENGVSSEPVTWTASGANGEFVELTVPNDAVGDLLLYGAYETTAGNLVYAAPELVARFEPISTLVGIEWGGLPVRPSAGGVFTPTLTAIYADGTRLARAIVRSEVEFISSDPQVVDVSDPGQWALPSAGLAVISARWRGFESTRPLRVYSTAIPYPAAVDESFELPHIPGLQSQDLANLPDWDQLSGLAIQGASRWPSADGVQHVELKDTNASLSRDVDLFPGLQYRLQFAMSGDLDRQAAYRLRATIDGNSQEFTFAAAQLENPTNIGWAVQSMLFTTSNRTATLHIQRIDGGSGESGPLLDAVRLGPYVDTPEPVQLHQLDSGEFGLRWDNGWDLQWTRELEGNEWRDVVPSTSPHVHPPDNPIYFWRLRKP